MKRTSRRVPDFIGTVAYLMTIFFLMAFPIKSGEFSSGQARQTRSANPDKSGLVKLGQFAPDFELPRLAIKTDDTGKPIGVISEKDTVKLSSFRGKKPVCLIMSSYT